MSSESTVASPKLEAAIAGVRRLAPSGYSLDGRAASIALAPASVDEVGRCLRAANDAGRGVVPWGGGTQLGLGNLAQSVDVALDFRGLNAIVEYEPHDMTIAVQAGHTLGELDRILAEHGQVLPVDATDPDRATLGGLVAAGMSGPRRFGYAPLRDLIIGIAAVLPDGREARAGGMVVKNVSGFDLMRLYHGSLGSLAVIVQVNLKVLPRYQAERTVLVRFDDLASASMASEVVRLSQFGVTAVVLLDRGAAARTELAAAPWTLAVRCEAPPVAVVRQAERVVQACDAGPNAADIVGADETPALWRRVARMLSAEPTWTELAVRLGVRPSEMQATGGRVADLAASASAGAATMLDVGSGLVYTRVPGSIDALRPVWGRLGAIGAHSTLITAPVAVREEIDVFGAEPAGFPVMRALKDQFDPNRILNRGRFAGHL